jgi:transposase
MPVRPFSREDAWLLPPTLDELVPTDHPARFVAAFVDSLPRAEWLTLGIDPIGDELGAPAYHARALLSVWLSGFMTGVRSTRKLEAACREQLPYLWLTGNQRPDHNTLWRFYQAHRQGMRELFDRTVWTAVRAGLVDLALQAVDGTKIGGNAARDRTFDAAGLRRLAERTAAAIADLEAQNATSDDAPPPRLPPDLTQARALLEKVQAALEQVSAEDGPNQVNLTDPEARLVKTHQGFLAGYNAQAMVSPLAPDTAGRSGLLITAARVVGEQDDHGQLLPMLEQAEAVTGQAAELTLADGGYHSGPNLAACAQRGQTVAMPQGHRRAAATDEPYSRDAFTYDAESDTYTCPEAQTLTFAGLKHRPGRGPARLYRASGLICRACPAFGTCTKSWRQGRTLEIGPDDAALRRHRGWMATDQAKAAYRQRGQLAEPPFGILKDQQGARRFLLRGLANVRAEWALLVTAFNLRTLCRIWQLQAPAGLGALVGAAI